MSGPCPTRRATIAATLVCCVLSAPHAHAVLLLNEVFADPDGVDDNREYVELLSTTGADTLQGVTLLEIESDSDTARGDIDRIVELDDATLNADGLLVLIDTAPTANPYGLEGPHVVDLNSTRIEQDATFLLVTGFEGIVGDTVDEDRDGVIDREPWTSILDAVTLNTLEDGDADYAGAAPQIVDADRAPDALARSPGAHGVAAADAWYGGVIATSSEPGADNLTFRDDEGLLTPNFPTGGMLTPGALNAPSATSGDLDGDGRVTAADYTAWRDGLGDQFAAGDYLAWRDAYGASTTAAAAPEPCSALLAALATCGWVRRRGARAAAAT